MSLNKDQVHVSDNIQMLTGVGLEYLVDATGEWVMAKFLDGNFITSTLKCTAEEAEKDTVPC